MKKKLLILGGVLIVMGAVLMLLGFTVLKKRGDLEEKIYTKAAVMPMAYKVYGNKDVENGKYFLAKTVFCNVGDGMIRDLTISYRIPGYIEWTTPIKYQEVLPHQTVVDLFYPKFSRKILEILNATPATVEIRYNYNDGTKTHEIIKRRDFQIRGRDELVYSDMPEEEISTIQDMYTNVNLVACFVTPEDPIIKYFTQQLQKNILHGSTAGAGGGRDEVMRFMRGLYEFEKAAGIVYGGTLGLPERVGGKPTVVQRIRLPREVLTGGAGLCIELSTLFASVASSAGLDPVIFVVSNHAFPGVIVGNDVIAIEATGVGGAGIGGSLSFEKAIEIGTENARRVLNGMPVNGAPPIAVLRINALQAQGYRPPDLQDSSTLRKKIDAIFEKMLATPEDEGIGGIGIGGVPAQNGAIVTMPKNGIRTYTDPSGLFSFRYPADWEMMPTPIPSLPNLRLIVGDPNATYEAEFYIFKGIYNVDRAIQELANAIMQMGEQITYQPAGTMTINGYRYKRYAGVTVAGGMQLNWVAYFTRTSRGVVGFVLGSYTNNLNVPELKVIKNSFKVRR